MYPRAMAENLPPRDLRPEDEGQSVPIYAVWELTMKCDQPCQHCGSRAGHARDRELSTAEVLEVAASLADLGCREIALIGGEAYLRTDLHEIIAFLAGRGLRVGVQTGGRAHDAGAGAAPQGSGPVRARGLGRRARRRTRRAARQRRQSRGGPARARRRPRGGAQGVGQQPGEPAQLPPPARDLRRAARARDRGVAGAAHRAHGPRRRSAGVDHRAVERRRGHRHAGGHPARGGGRLPGRSSPPRAACPSTSSSATTSATTARTR